MTLASNQTVDVDLMEMFALFSVSRQVGLIDMQKVIGGVAEGLGNVQKAEGSIVTSFRNLLAKTSVHCCVFSKGGRTRYSRCFN